MKQIHLKLFVYLLLVVQTTANPYAGGDQGYSGSRSSFNLPVIGSELTSGMTSGIGLVGPVPAMGINRGLAPNTCFNIIDAEFPGFSSYCSVLPQTTYSLPNFFGHQSKQETNALLTAMKSTLDSGCFSHIRMFVCPLFFPPCTGTTVLPCAQFCETVKSRCQSPELDMIDCNALPAQSRFCPAVIVSNAPRNFGSTGSSYSYDNTRNVVVNPPRFVPPTQSTYSSSSQEESSFTENSFQSNEHSSFTTTTLQEPTNSYGASVSGAASSFSPSMTLSKSFSSYGAGVQEAPKLIPVAPLLIEKTLPKSVDNSYGSSSFNTQSSSSSYGSGGSFAPPRTLTKTVSSYGAGVQEAPKVLIAGPKLLGKTFMKSVDNGYGSSSFDSGSSSSSYGSRAALAPPRTLTKSFSSYGAGVQEAPKFMIAGPKLIGKTLAKNTGSSYGSSSSFDSGSSSSSSSYGNSASFAPPRLLTMPVSHRGLNLARTSFDGSSSYGGSSSSSRSNTNSYGYGSSSGIQSTGSEETFVEPPLDLTKCGTITEANPCTQDGPQFFPLSSTPFCYIHCDGPYMFVKPCPGDLIWNAEINTCDWPTVIEVPSVPSVDTSSSSFSNMQSSNTNSQSGYSYGRKKRATKERKKRFFPFLPEFLDPVASKVPLGPPLPGIVPLPGFIGPIGLPGPLYPPFFPPFLFPGLGPIIPPILPPPILPGLPPPIAGPGLPPPAAPAPAPAPAPAYGPSDNYAPPPPQGQPAGPSYGPSDNYAPPPQAPPSGPSYGAPNNYAPPPAGPSYGPPNNYAPPPPAAPAPPPPPPVAPLPPPIVPGPLLPAPIIPPIIPMLPPFPPPFFPPYRPKKYGGKYGSKKGGKYGDKYDDDMSFNFGGTFGGPFGPIGVEPLFNDPWDLDLGGGFPFGEDFYGGSPAPFFEPIPFPGGCKSKRRNGKCDSSSSKSYGKKDYDDDYSSYDDDYGYSKKSSYKKNGGFKSYGSKKNDYSYKSNYDNYRKKRQYAYGSAMTEERPVFIPQTPKVFTSSYGSGMQEARIAVPMQPLIPVVQPVAFSPCANHQGKGNIAHPTDSSKYIACLNTEKYEIMDCPEGLIYDAENDQCKKIREEETLCDRLKPCMNDGHCYVTGPSSYKCTCRSGWTGEHCEVPLSSCASNPCGAGNECHSLKVNDYKQDYVCVCDGRSAYGSTCERNTVPNPCMALSSEQQYYAFAFSSHAYVQCNGELLAFQPCPTGLYWNQENKVCDHEITINPVSLDQPESYQTGYNTVEQTVETITRPPTIVFDETIERPQGNRYRNYNSYMTNERSNIPLQPTFVRPETPAPMFVERSYAATPKLRPMQRNFQSEESYSSDNSYSNSNERRESFTEQQGYQTVPTLPKMTWSMRSAPRTFQPTFRASSYRR